MFKKVLVALDMSSAEKPIVDCLPALRQWGVEQIILTHVIVFGYGHGAALAYEDDYRDWLEKQAEAVRQPGLTVSIDVRASGVPADELLNAASKHDVDLLVIGSRSQNIVSKLFLGSVAREVIRKSTTPVLLEWIEPSAEATQKQCEAICTDALRHVMLATDFSKQAMAAENAAIALAKNAAVVDCVHVLTPAEKENKPTLPSMAEAALNQLIERIKTNGGKGQITLLEGDAASQLSQHATDINASLIIVGKHGQNWLASTLTGSTAAKLCEIAGRPVLMVP